MSTADVRNWKNCTRARPPARRSHALERREPPGPRAARSLGALNGWLPPSSLTVTTRREPLHQTVLSTYSHAGTLDRPASIIFAARPHLTCSASECPARSPPGRFPYRAGSRASLAGLERPGLAPPSPLKIRIPPSHRYSADVADRNDLLESQPNLKAMRSRTKGVLSNAHDTPQQKMAPTQTISIPHASNDPINSLPNTRAE